MAGILGNQPISDVVSWVAVLEMLHNNESDIDGKGNNEAVENKIYWTI